MDNKFDIVGKSNGEYITKAGTLLVPLHSAEDVFKAKDASKLDLSNFIEIACLFWPLMGLGMKVA